MEGLLLLSLLSLISPSYANPKGLCSKEKIKLIRENKKGSVFIDCNFTLNKKDQIVKTLVFEGSSASNLNIDCSGATIIGTSESLLVRSKKNVDQDNKITWDRPQNINIKNCILKNPARVFGMARNGEGEDLKHSSILDENHHLRAQKSAPKKIIFSNFNFKTNSGIPLYISPGVTYFTLENSTFEGSTSSVSIYLDAESSHNQIKNNIFMNKYANKREAIAIDGSAYNKIASNEFRSMNLGGIFLYRNSGEGGTIRHQTPHDNEILNNRFFVNDTTNFKAAVFVNSRDGSKETRYNEDDSGYYFGSSIDNNSLAQNNVVAGNQIAGNYPINPILVNYQPNYVFKNKTTKNFVPKIEGCVLKVKTVIKSYLENNQTEVIGDVLYSCLNQVISSKKINICKIELNTNNRLVIRDSNQKGLAYFKPRDTALANEELNRLISIGACYNTAAVSSDTTTPIPQTPSKPSRYGYCFVEKNNKNRWVVRSESKVGLFYYSTSNEAGSKLNELIKSGDCKI